MLSAKVSSRGHRSAGRAGVSEKRMSATAFAILALFILLTAVVGAGLMASKKMAEGGSEEGSS